MLVQLLVTKSAPPFVQPPPAAPPEPPVALAPPVAPFPPVALEPPVAPEPPPSSRPSSDASKVPGQPSEHREVARTPSSPSHPDARRSKRSGMMLLPSGWGIQSARSYCAGPEVAAVSRAVLPVLQRMIADAPVVRGQRHHEHAPRALLASPRWPRSHSLDRLPPHPP